jgi:cell wall-associated NlpC family hydrolase
MPIDWERLEAPTGTPYIRDPWLISSVTAEGSKAFDYGRTAVVNAALKYQGTPSVANGSNPSGFDCSGLVNWVLGHDLGLVIPRGIRGFDGSFPGPSPYEYLHWLRGKRVFRPMAGTLCVWANVLSHPLIPYNQRAYSHIGIAISEIEMISAGGLFAGITTIQSLIPTLIRPRFIDLKEFGHDG